MNGWKTIKWAGTQATGPAKDIDAQARVLDDAGVFYTVEDYVLPPRGTKYTGDDIEYFGTVEASDEAAVSVEVKHNN